MFTIKGSEDAEIPAEEFTDILRSSLRQSDIVTQSGKNQFMVMLLEMSHFNIEVVIDRIMGKWNANEALQSLELSYELDILK